MTSETNDGIYSLTNQFIFLKQETWNCCARRVKGQKNCRRNCFPLAPLTEVLWFSAIRSKRYLLRLDVCWYCRAKIEQASLHTWPGLSRCPLTRYCIPIPGPITGSSPVWLDNPSKADDLACKINYKLFFPNIVNTTQERRLKEAKGTWHT